jgi:hypothetical protein
MYIGFHVKYSCPILTKLEFSEQILEKYSNINFLMKIIPAEAKLLRADRHT